MERKQLKKMKNQQKQYCWQQKINLNSINFLFRHFFLIKYLQLSAFPLDLKLLKIYQHDFNY